MPDLTPDLLPTIKSYRLPGFDLGDEFTYPNYNGRSICPPGSNRSRA